MLGHYDLFTMWLSALKKCMVFKLHIKISSLRTYCFLTVSMFLSLVMLADPLLLPCRQSMINLRQLVTGHILRLNSCTEKFSQIGRSEDLVVICLCLEPYQRYIATSLAMICSGAIWHFVKIGWCLLIKMVILPISLKIRSGSSSFVMGATIGLCVA